MNAWTKIMGYPVVSVDSHLDLEESHLRLQITQTRFLNTGYIEGEDDNTIWSIPLRLVTDNSKNLAGNSALSVLNTRSTTIDLPADTSYFKFNYNQAGFYRVQYPREWLERLGQAIEQGYFEASDRIGIFSDIFSLSLAGKVRLTEVFKLVRFSSNEDDYTVWGVLTSRLNEVLSVWWEQDPPLVHNLKSFIRNIYSRKVQTLGFDFEKDEEDKISLMRPLIIGMAGKCGDQEVLREARARFSRFAAGEFEAIHPNLRDVIFGFVIEQGGQEEYNQVLKLYQNFTVPDQKQSALSALGSSRHASILKSCLELSKCTDIVRPQDLTVLLRTVGINPFGRRLLWDYVQKNWQLFYDRYSRGGILLLSRIVSYSTQEFSQIQDADAILKFFTVKEVSSIDRTIQQSIEKVHSNAYWLINNKEDLTQFFC
jgi:aminopeptidase 2